MENRSEAYEQTIRLKPDYAEAYFFLGLVYRDSVMYREAVESFKQAIRIKPDFADAHNELGCVYIKLRMYREAVESF